MNPVSLVAMGKQAFAAWVDDYAPSMGAALAYYTLFSLAPLLLIVVSIAGLVFGADAARGEIFAELRDLVGDDGAAAAQSLLQSLNKPAQGIVGTVVGVVTLLIGAASVFGELQNSLDRIWRAPPRRELGAVDAGPRAPALVRHGPRLRLPAHRLARREHRHRRARQALGGLVRRLGDRSPKA